MIAARRMIWAVTSSLSGEKPGATTYSRIGRGKRTSNRETTSITKDKELRTEEVSLQACFKLAVKTLSESTGMKATLRAPAEKV